MISRCIGSTYRMDMPSFNYITGCNEEDKTNIFFMSVIGEVVVMEY